MEGTDTAGGGEGVAEDLALGVVWEGDTGLGLGVVGAFALFCLAICFSSFFCFLRACFSS